jgi:PGF-pre-PGF domain-containing protein
MIQQHWNWTVTNPVSNTDVISSTSSSSGGGGGGGSTGEKYENIAYKDVLSEFVSKGDIASYEFDDERNSIEYIRFQAFRNWGKISSTIEMLHNRSALVDVNAPDTVYSNINLWVGKSAFSSSENIGNSVVGFRVEKSWIEENNVDVDTIKLCRYSDDEWSYLDTRKISEDTNSLHFEASTPGFSPFAIVGHSVEKVTTGEVEKLKTTDSVENDIYKEKNVSTKPKGTFNNLIAIGSLFILLIGGFVGYVVYRKRS